MRALAGFVMRGRLRAIAVIALGVLVPPFIWISAAVIALVVLRRSGQDVLLIAGGAALASLLAAPPLNLLLFMLVAGVAIGAGLLRWSRSWPLALAGIVGAGLLTGLLLHQFAAGFLDASIVPLNAAIEAENAKRAATPQTLPQWSTVDLSALLALSVVTPALIGLLLARWWQAQLYNPGGFREEFHRLRIPPPIAAGLVAVGLLSLSWDSGMRWWPALVSLPFVVAGAALVHGVVAIKHWSRRPLVIFYVIALPLLSGLVALLAVMDSWWDFRGRLQRAQNDRL
jgi:hypothetical protein